MCVRKNEAIYFARSFHPSLGVVQNLGQIACGNIIIETTTTQGME